MNQEEVSDVDVETATQPEREIDWAVSPEGETSLEYLLFVLGIE